jgi:hypothetical protein
MRTRLCWLAALGFIVGVAASAGAAPPPSSGSGIRLGFRLDYLTQTVSWDDNGTKLTSALDAATAAAVLQFGIGRDSTASLFVGYSSSKLNGIMFRGLPFSVDYEAGGAGGVAVGGELNLALLAGRGVSISAQTRFLAHLGSSKTWSLTGLAVTGTVSGKPTWMRALVGPVVAFGTDDGVRPYLFPFFQYVWGTFEMSESIQSLSGNENKDIRGKSLFGIAGGLELPLSPGVKLKAEAGVYPRGGGADYSATVGTMFAF